MPIGPRVPKRKYKNNDNPFSTATEVLGCQYTHHDRLLLACVPMVHRNMKLGHGIGHTAHP